MEVLSNTFNFENFTIFFTVSPLRLVTFRPSGIDTNRQSTSPTVADHILTDAKRVTCGSGGGFYLIQTAPLRRFVRNSSLRQLKNYLSTAANGTLMIIVGPIHADNLNN